MPQERCPIWDFDIRTKTFKRARREASTRVNSWSWPVI
ncbi:hypothetical protein BIWAKO_04774 [Bosea sp. BIWAKO-01]|nr:hypothetical protein BIWAKO_04774 [Bosea sp. BIWAKO-01]